jgi:hypothetical protein
MRASAYQGTGDRYRYRTLLLELPDLADDAGAFGESGALGDVLGDDAGPEESDGTGDGG